LRQPNLPLCVRITGKMIAVISLILLIAIFAIGVWTLVLIRKQDRRETDAQIWTIRFDEAVHLVLKIRPVWLETPQTPNETSAYGLLFPAELRKRIEFHLIFVPPSGSISEARRPTREQLLTSGVQETINEVLDRAEEFKRTNPFEARQIGILQ
jgi:hypothetical protein